ncbi:hypothetical protein BU15DRAFT_65070 [Melanogaster broomeanus]|nr:hypothetical protein BU15DRAFT_65070 [Melanogaster broomeanus]
MACVGCWLHSVHVRLLLLLWLCMMIADGLRRALAAWVLAAWVLAAWALAAWYVRWAVVIVMAAHDDCRWPAWGVGWVGGHKNTQTDLKIGEWASKHVGGHENAPVVMKMGGWARKRTSGHENVLWLLQVVVNRMGGLSSSFVIDELAKW